MSLEIALLVLYSAPLVAAIVLMIHQFIATERVLAAIREDNRQWEAQKSAWAEATKANDRACDAIIDDMEANLSAFKASLPEDFKQWLRRDHDNHAVN